MKVVDNPSGSLRIAFNPPPPLVQDVFKGEENANFAQYIYGPLQAEQIYFPPTDDESTNRILECIRRGLVLQSLNGQILATRLSRAKIFFSDSVVNCNNELPREQTSVIFDYHNDFQPKLRDYMKGAGPCPTFERYFSFAQKWNETRPISNNYVRVTVTHCLAQRCFNEVLNSKHEFLISEPNDLDNLAKQIDSLFLGKAS